MLVVCVVCPAVHDAAYSSRLFTFVQLLVSLSPALVFHVLCFLVILTS